MNRFPLIFPLWVVFLFAIAPTHVFGAWFDPTWQYRVPVNIPATAPVNSTIKVDVDFAALLTSLGVTGTFDSNSPRVVRSNDTLSTTQEFTDRIYAGATDAAGNARGEIRFILQDAGSATYYLYFDITANGTKAANPQTPINGNFEVGTSGQEDPIGWAGTKSNVNYDAQIRPSETVSATAIPSTADGVNPRNTDGTPNTGQFSYLMGLRTGNSSSTGNPGVTLTRTIVVPATNPGNFSIRYRPEGWDSSDNGSTSFDFIRIELVGSSTSEIVGPTAGNYTTFPFSPNLRTAQASATQSGYRQYNGWDCDLSGNHRSGMTIPCRSELWFTRTVSLVAYAGQTITLRIRSFNDAPNDKTWHHIDDVEWSVIAAALGTPSANVSNIVPANFNCVESGASASTGTIYTKLAGMPFSFDVVALKADGSVETGYAASTSKNVTVELVDGSSSTACSSPINPAVSQTLTFAAANSGRKAAASITVSKAYPNLRCRVTDANQSPNIVGCSTDNFSVRPGTATLITTASAIGPSVTAAPVIKAGAAFTIGASTATSATDGYIGTLSLDSTKLTAQLPSNGSTQQSGGAVGSLTVSPAVQANASPSQSNNARWNEVGYLYAAAGAYRDDSYTSVDQAAGDCIFSTTGDANLADSFDINNKIGCSIGNKTAVSFGRFIPDHFALTQGLATAGCGTVFTYFGQDGFTTSLTLTAQNSSNGTTQNYSGSFAKLGLTNWSSFVFTSASLPSGSSLSASATAPTGTWNLGVAAVSAKHQVSRPTSITGQTSVIVNAAPVDADGVTMASAPVAPSTPLRYGRINLSNAHGSELLDLAVPMQAEYYNGTSFIANSNDVCSVSTVSITDPVASDGLVPADSCVWDDSSTSGSFRCITTAPSGASYQEAGALSAGSFNLNLKASGLTGSLDISASVANWLQFNWHGTGIENPSSRATFGIYKGSEKTIYFREVY